MLLYPIILAGEGGAAKIGQHKVGTEKERENRGKRYSIVLSNTQRPSPTTSSTFVNGNAVHPWTVFYAQCTDAVDSWFSMGLSRFVFGGDTAGRRSLLNVPRQQYQLSTDNVVSLTQPLFFTLTPISRY